VISACEAITVAAVAKAIIGSRAQDGTARKNGLDEAPGLVINRAPWPK
jgi:hypothetical protein